MLESLVHSGHHDVNKVEGVASGRGTVAYCFSGLARKICQNFLAKTVQNHVLRTTMQTWSYMNS